MKGPIGFNTTSKEFQSFSQLHMFADGLVALLNEGKLIIKESRCEIHPEFEDEARKFHMAMCSREQEKEQESIAADASRTATYRDVIMELLNEPRPVPQKNASAPYRLMGYYLSRPFTSSVAQLLDHIATLPLPFVKSSQWKLQVRSVISALVKTGDLTLLDAQTFEPLPAEIVDHRHDKRLVSLSNRSAVLQRMDADKKIIEELTALYVSNLPGRFTAVEGKVYDAIRAGKVMSMERVFPSSTRDRSIPLFYYIPNLSSSHKNLTQFLRSKCLITFDSITLMVYSFQNDWSQDSQCSSSSDYSDGQPKRNSLAVKNIRTTSDNYTVSFPPKQAHSSDEKLKEALQRVAQFRNATPQQQIFNGIPPFAHGSGLIPITSPNPSANHTMAKTTHTSQSFVNDSQANGSCVNVRNEAILSMPLPLKLRPLDQNVVLGNSIVVDLTAED